MARKLAPSIDLVVVDVAAVEEENVKERETWCRGSEWWRWRLQKNLHVVVVAAEAKPRRERRERGWSNGEGGGEALRGRERGRQCTETKGSKATAAVAATKGGRRSSSKGKRRNRGHARGEEFLCPKRRDSNAVVSGNCICM